MIEMGIRGGCLMWVSILVLWAPRWAEGAPLPDSATGKQVSARNDNLSSDYVNSECFRSGKMNLMDTGLKYYAFTLYPFTSITDVGLFISISQSVIWFPSFIRMAIHHWQVSTDVFLTFLESWVIGTLQSENINKLGNANESNQKVLFDSLGMCISI